MTSDIVRHLSNLRINNKIQRRNSGSNETYRSLPRDLLIPSKDIKDATNIFSLSESNEFDPFDPRSYPQDLLDPGIEMIRVTRRKMVKRCFRLDLSDFSLKWNTKQTSKLSIEKIKSIRIGEDARNYREQLNVSEEFQESWITIIYLSTSSATSSYSLGNSLKVLHIIAPTKRHFEMITKTLKRLHEWSLNHENLLNCANISEFSTIKWNTKIKGKQCLTFEEVLKMCDELHINMDPSYIRHYFEHSKAELNSLKFDEFETFIGMLRERIELNVIFSDLRVEKGKMDRSKFYYFVTNVQKENLSLELIDNLFEQFSFRRNNEYITINGLASFLTSKHSIPYIIEDLDDSYYSLPLNNYFVASSHNTYLLGKQVHGISSIEGYIHALQRGCRCIEIDVWNNTVNSAGNPVVTHGHTFTTSIDLKLVAETIKKYAFIASPYPLIISLEIKCSVVTQLKTAEIFKATFGDILIEQPLDNESKLPSPNDLKYKVLLKVKKSAMTIYNDPDTEKMYPSFSTTSSTISDSADDSAALNKIVKRKTRQFITPELTELAPYLIGISFRNFSLPESKTFNHVFSFSDRTLMSMMRDETKILSILKHNRRGLMRVYPSVIRYKSDNFNPIPFWEVGCQFVATNWQLWDCGQELSQSLFKSTGLLSNLEYSGYRLKPECMRIINPNQDKQELKLELLKNLEKNLERCIDIAIITGQQLPKPFDSTSDYTPWLEVKFYNIKPKYGKFVNFGNQGGLGTSTIAGIAKKQIIDDPDNLGIVKIKNVDRSNTDPRHDVVFKTRVAQNMNNLFKPVWNICCKLNYLTSTNDISFVRIIVKCAIKSKSSAIKKVGNVVVKSPSECIIGSWCCKLSDLKCGYRYISLVDKNGDDIPHASLLINVRKTNLTE